MRTIKKLSHADSAAIFAYIASGGLVNVYESGKRALPPYYNDSDPRPPRFYCIHTPRESYSAAPQ